MAKPKRKRRTTPPKVTGPCPFCEANSSPDYKNYKELSQFLSDRAKILGKDRTGVCSRHQRALATSIKRARHLGLLPFSPTL